MTNKETPHASDGELYSVGLRVGFGIAALTIGLVSFLSLLGVEKAVTAIVFGALAMRGVAPGRLANRLGIAGVILGAVFLVTLAILLVLFHDRAMELIRMLAKLS